MRDGDRYFDLLLALLPGAFRARHGDDLKALFRAMKLELGPGPTGLSRLRLYAAITWDVLRQIPWSASTPTAPGERSRWWDALRADLRFAIRQFRRNWVTTAAMLLILCVGMSLSVLLFSLVQAYASSPPPDVPRAEELVRIRGSFGPRHGGGARAFEADELARYERLTDQFAAVVGWTDIVANIDVPGLETPETGAASFVTDNYFPILGVRPVLGPGLRPADRAELHNVAVISDGVWERFFGRNPDVLGRTMSVNGVPVSVVGVAPERFTGINRTHRHKVWMPLDARHAILPTSATESLTFRAVAELHPGVDLAAASAATAAVAAIVAAEHPGRESRDPGTEVVPLLSANGDPFFDRDVKLLALSLSVLGLLILGITCTNVSALLTGLAAARRHEIVVRLSLGASRARVVRQLLAESALVALTAAAAAMLAIRALLAQLLPRLPGLPLEIGITWQAVVFSVGVALLAAGLFGLAPALHASHSSVAVALRDSDRSAAAGRLRLQRYLVIAQVAVTQPLVVALVAVLLVVAHGYGLGNRSETGNQLISLQLVRTSGSLGTLPDPPAELVTLDGEAERVRAALRETPGVAAVAAESAPVAGARLYQIHPADSVSASREEPLSLILRSAGPDYFYVKGLPIVRGRAFSSTDLDGASSGTDASEAPIIIGEELAGRLWPGANVVGRRLDRMGDYPGPRSLVIVGVATDSGSGGGGLLGLTGAVRQRGRQDADSVYVPDGSGRRNLLVRTTGDAQSLLGAIRALASDEAPNLTAIVRTVAEREEAQSRAYRLAMTILLGVAGTALLISAIGLYAVAAFGVGQRTREIAVRIAVGAQTRQIALSFLAIGVRLAATGLAIGLPLSLVGLRTWNGIPQPGLPAVALPHTTAIVAAAVLSTAVIATVVPALRSARVDPAEILRHQ